MEGKDFISRELNFLLDQPDLVKQQQQIAIEMETLLMKMKSLAEYRITKDFNQPEVKKLTDEMQYYEAQYNFLKKMSEKLYASNNSFIN